MEENEFEICKMMQLKNGMKAFFTLLLGYVRQLFLKEHH